MTDEMIHGRSPELWTRMIDEATDVLKSVARVRTTIAYSDFNARLGDRVEDAEFDLQQPPERNALSSLLAAVAERSNKAGDGMLSAVVVAKDKDKLGPSGGFFELARHHGWIAANADADHRYAFWVDQLNLVYEANSRRPRTSRST